jgi:hypothetical protein
MRDAILDQRDLQAATVEDKRQIPERGRPGNICGLLRGLNLANRNNARSCCAFPAVVEDARMTQDKPNHSNAHKVDSR